MRAPLHTSARHYSARAMSAIKGYPSVPWVVALAARATFSFRKMMWGMIVWSSLSIKTTLARAQLFPDFERLVSKNYMDTILPQCDALGVGSMR